MDLISVIIPVFNHERYIGEAIESVLAQTYRPLELIVIDDGSTDRSGAVAQSFGSPVRYYHQANEGQGAARNHGVSLARGAYLSFLDADDLWPSEKLAWQMAAFEADPGLDIVFGHVTQFHTLDGPPNPARHGNRSLDTAPGYLPSAMLIKTSSFQRVGDFSTAWKIGEVVDWYMRAREAGLKSLMLPQVVLQRRIHQDNSGIRSRGSQGDYVRILKAAIDRRREQQSP